jgi:hypothetical protein
MLNFHPTSNIHHPNKILNHGITYNTLLNRFYYLYFRIKNAFESQNCKKRKLIAAAGMTIAILGTIFLYQDDEGKKLGNYVWIFGGILIGTIIGAFCQKSKNDGNATNGKFSTEWVVLVQLLFL